MKLSGEMYILLFLVFSSVDSVNAAEKLEVHAVRPAVESWSRTQCGSPSGNSPAVPKGDYVLGTDHAGNDMDACGSKGCVLAASASYDDCEKMCENQSGCVMYVFAPANCSGQTGPICWTKNGISTGSKKSCRNSRIMGQPATTGADIPSKWAEEVSADKTPLTKYPRPQMVRGSGKASDLRENGDPSQWTNLNGLWEWEPVSDEGSPPFQQTLKNSILVPFPVESCLSSVAPNSTDAAMLLQKMWYRLTFDAARTTTESGTDQAQAASSGRTLLHFGAIDWQSSIWLNGQLLGNHTGGYDGFSFEVDLKPTDNELLVYAFDPSNLGSQPNGKQRITAISSPGGDTYTPNSGIWQTVWMEAVPDSYIKDVKINQASNSEVIVSVDLSGGDSSITLTVVDQAGAVVATVNGSPGSNISIPIKDAKLWSPGSPYLYDLHISTDTDAVTSYFGLRTFELGNGPKGRRPLLNGKFTFLAGFLDQSWWPDGQYTAPTDEGLAYDIQAVPMFGLNMIRLHQKVNPERWYYHADRIGVVVLQDMVQKYGGASDQTVPYFVDDFKAMVRGRGNHPCIVQFETFNEGDCWGVFKNKPFDVAGIVALSKELDPTRLVDTDSGGKANNLHIGDVNDIHSYPNPGDPQPSSTQYAMIGEFGGIGAFVEGKEWKPKSCHTYLHVDTPADEADAYIKMAASIQSRVDHVSASVYTQTTDLELECDGFLNYDRSNKFSANETAAIKEANQAIINAASQL